MDGMRKGGWGRRTDKWRDDGRKREKEGVDETKREKKGVKEWGREQKRREREEERQGNWWIWQNDGEKAWLKNREAKLFKLFFSALNKPRAVIFSRNEVNYRRRSAIFMQVKKKDNLWRRPFHYQLKHAPYRTLKWLLNIIITCIWLCIMFAMLHSGRHMVLGNRWSDGCKICVSVFEKECVSMSVCF